MKTSSQSAFISLTRSLDRIARSGDIRALRTFLASDGFIRDFVKLDPEPRQRVLTITSALMGRLKARIGPIVRETATKASKWNDLLVARLRKAEARYGDDEDIARALGLTIKAAARARLRYIGPRARPAYATEDSPRIAA